MGQESQASSCLSNGTLLASRVVQGVSGPSSSCVWNPRVFADDARGWQTEEQSVQNEKRRFLAVFRQRYNEYCGFPYEQTVDPTVLFIVGELVSRFIQEGTNSVEYLQWFFEVQP